MVDTNIFNVNSMWVTCHECGRKTLRANPYCMYCDTLLGDFG